MHHCVPPVCHKVMDVLNVCENYEGFGPVNVLCCHAFHTRKSPHMHVFYKKQVCTKHEAEIKQKLRNISETQAD